MPNEGPLPINSTPNAFRDADGGSAAGGHRPSCCLAAGADTCAAAREAGSAAQWCRASVWLVAGAMLEVVRCKVCCKVTR